MATENQLLREKLNTSNAILLKYLRFSNTYLEEMNLEDIDREAFEQLKQCQALPEEFVPYFYKNGIL